MDRQGTSINRPPFFDGTNYSQWKIRMKIFIKSIDERVWRSILTGWTPPTTVDDNGEEIIKPEIDWTDEESEISGYNSEALNAIFNAVDASYFELISKSTSAKEAWEILQAAHEENGRVRMWKRRMLAMRFEKLRMHDDETVSTFNARLRDIANEARELGEPYGNEELVMKVLRSLPERFAEKVVAIEGCRDVATLKLEELIASLQAFEMRLAHRGSISSRVESSQVEGW